MGLDTTHDCWHGPYSAFGRWRNQVAKAVGIELAEMDGFGGNRKWSTLKKDVIHVLLQHSDCDGEIEAKDCAALADRLEPLIDRIDPGWLVLGPATVGPTQRFVNGLRVAAAAGEAVEFH